MLSSSYLGAFQQSSFQTYQPRPIVRQALDQAVLRAFPVATTDLWSPKRGRPSAAQARQVGMYLAHVACGLTLTEVGRIFARDRTTVAYACAAVEDRREDPRFDRALDLLEGVMRALAPHAPSIRHKIN